MSVRKEEFINDEIYHVTVRGVEGRQFFIDDEDRWRGIFSLYEFNTKKQIIIRNQREKRKTLKKRRGLASAAALGIEIDQRARLVDILSFVFMPNHLHLLVRQRELNGVSMFMQKMGSGYSGYFNLRYKRKGHLFQGKFAARHISGEEDLKRVFVYINTNPISLIDPEWKQKGVRDCAKVKKFLLSYRWSSYIDYLGIKNFPSVSERDFLLKIFGSSENAKKYVEDWIDNKRNLS
ncbi:MAG: transposase [Candidatus Paceibacterota bacterium]